MSNGSRYNFKVTEDEVGIRLDQYMARVIAAQSRSYLQKIIKDGNVLVNGVIKKSSYEVKYDDEITAEMPLPVSLDVLPENIPLDVIYEDESLLVINKPAGLVVHPAAGHFEHTLVNALLYHCGSSLSGIGGVLRPGIVHRLDKDTSGCILAAKNDTAHNALIKQFQDRTVLKEYRSLVNGWVKELSGKIETIIGRHPSNRKRMAVRVDTGKEALTEYEVIERFEKASFLGIILGTGRTHQIRVHLAHIGHPVLGDEEYGKKKSRLQGIEIKRQMLHAYRIGFTHPVDNKWMEFCAPIPDDMQELLDYIKKERK
jgi:23S rRNA pseudouridine1911/1915/1917 synthase